ncbi:MAG: oligoribonuclease [Acidimicrobiales bacterium]
MIASLHYYLNMLLWMDLEMTGLDPSHDAIVEIATLATDDDLNILAEGPDLVIHADDDLLGGMEAVVRGMHERSGLLSGIRASTITLQEAEQATLEFVKEFAREPRTVPLCGNSIGTDRRFLLAQMPSIEEWLHYRSIDVSTIKELASRWYPEILSGAPKKRGLHRALDDIRASVDELKYYRKTFFVERAPVATNRRDIHAEPRGEGC